jgi:hypothetical protein
LQTLAHRSAITLNADFSPVAQETPLGQASAPSQIDAGTDYELDVTNSGTGAALFSKTSVSLVSGNVYTLFMSLRPLEGKRA